MIEEEVSIINHSKPSPSSQNEKNSSLIPNSTAEEEVQLDYQENEEETNNTVSNDNSSEQKAQPDGSNDRKKELESPDPQNLEEVELEQQDEDLDGEDNLELRSLNDEEDGVDVSENSHEVGEMKSTKEKKRPRTPPFPCPDADEADEDEEEELQEEVADDEDEEKGQESAEEADVEQKKEERSSKERRKDRAEVPKAYQMSRDTQRRTGGGAIRRRRRFTLKNRALDSVEVRLAKNRRKRLKRLRAARLQRMSESARRHGNNTPPSGRRGGGRRSDDYRDKRRRSRSRSPLRRGRPSPVRRAAIPSLMSTRVRTPPSRRYDNPRRYGGYSGRRSRSPLPRRMSRDQRQPPRRHEAAGSSRPAFVGNDQYRIYIHSDPDRRPRRVRSPSPRHGRFEPYKSRDRGGRMESVRRNKIPSLLSLRASPPPGLRDNLRGGSRRSSPPHRRRSPPLRSYVKGEEISRPRTSRWPKCPPRERSP